MANKFRLHSESLFERTEEKHQEKPLRIIFLSVEGNDTEIQYLSWLEKYREELGIKMGVHIHPLKRAKTDSGSAPRDVLELLEEYVELRSTTNLPERIKSQVPDTYSIEFIENYLNNKDSLDREQKKAFEALLRQAGIDLQYKKFLMEFTGEDDIFGIVVDRDQGNHTVTQLQDIKTQCEESGYKFFITTPLIEFWLLLHLTDIRQTYPDRLEEFRKNPTVSSNHTAVSFEVSKLAGHKKNIKEGKFKAFYLPKVDYALKQLNESFCTDVDLLIGSEESEDSKYGLLGSNLNELFLLLREV